MQLQKNYAVCLLDVDSLTKISLVLEIINQNWNKVEVKSDIAKFEFLYLIFFM